VGSHISWLNSKTDQPGSSSNWNENGDFTTLEIRPWEREERWGGKGECNSLLVHRRPYKNDEAPCVRKESTCGGKLQGGPERCRARGEVQVYARSRIVGLVWNKQGLHWGALRMQNTRTIYAPSGASQACQGGDEATLNRLQKKKKSTRLSATKRMECINGREFMGIPARSVGTMWGKDGAHAAQPSSDARSLDGMACRKRPRRLVPRAVPKGGSFRRMPNEK